jgi:hypothetical protein
LPTISSLRALAAGVVFGMTFVIGGCTVSGVDMGGNRGTVSTTVTNIP